MLIKDGIEQLRQVGFILTVLLLFGDRKVAFFTLNKKSPLEGGPVFVVIIEYRCKQSMTAFCYCYYFG